MKISKLTLRGQGKRITATLAVLVFIILGVGILRSSQAATPFIQAEPENGSVTAPVTIVTDNTASGGRAIKFGAKDPNAFTHPGILTTRAQLDFVKTKIAAGEQPWKKEYDYMANSYYGQLARTAKPVPDLRCSTDDNKAASYGYPQLGCEDIVTDSLSAYAQTLKWYYGGDPAYAANARKIITAWGSTMNHISVLELKYPDGAYVYPDGMLFGGWGGSEFVKAAEILRNTPGSGWTTADTALMENQFRTVYYPVLKDAWTGGQNRTTIMNETTMFMSVFNNDRTMYDYVVPQARHSIKSLMYMTSDGVQPLYPLQKGVKTYVDTPAELATIWSNPTSYINGLEQETCRDLGHMVMGFGSLANMAETARIQGLDLYGEEQSRFVAALELNAVYTSAYLDQTNNTWNKAVPNGWKPANFPCSTFSPTAGGNASVGWEIAYNHYHGRKGVTMPKTEALTNRIRAMNTPTYRPANHMAWEILTHAGTP